VEIFGALPSGRDYGNFYARGSSCTVTICAAVLLVIAAIEMGAQDTNPLTNDANAAKLGEFEFRANCAFCHGLGARGGGRGPDLTRTQKKHGNADADLFRTINEGVPERPCRKMGDAAGRRDDGRRNLASDFIHSQRAAEDRRLSRREMQHTAKNCLQVRRRAPPAT